MPQEIETARIEALKLIETAKKEAVHLLDKRDKTLNEIKAKQDKHEELTRINGLNMSDIRKDLTEVNVKMDNQNIVLSEHTKLLKAVEPILKRYEDGEATKRELARYSKAVVGAGGFVGAWYIIKRFFLE